jgi:bifunctional non-homologous end joining protein LigD
MSRQDTDDIVVTHPDRVLFPELGVTKQDVADYYRSVIDWFLPGVRHRPTSVLRFPEGIGEQGFFQKHPMRGLSRVGHVRLREESGKWDDYLCPGDASSVIGLVQFGAIEFHPWAARAGSLDEPDYLVLDLDPGPGVDWSDIVDAARQVRDRLDRVDLRSFVRTTGGKGLHVVVPLHASCTWDDAKRFTQAFARKLADEQPRRFIAKAAMEARAGRIFLDYLRNSRGATSVASYSLRGRAGATVATPLRWQDLGKCKGPGDFHIGTLPRRLARLRGDPWEGFDALRQPLDTALRAYAEAAG